MKVGDNISTTIVLPSGKKIKSVAMCSSLNGDDGEYGYTLHFPNCHAYFNGDGKQVAEPPKLPSGAIGYGSIGANTWCVFDALPVQ